MDTQQWTHILTLLSVAVIIDSRVYKEEVDMFVLQSLKLKDVISPDMIFSKKMAFDWFMVHRDEIKAWAAPSSTICLSVCLSDQTSGRTPLNNKNKKRRNIQLRFWTAVFF